MSFIQYEQILCLDIKELNVQRFQFERQSVSLQEPQRELGTSPLNCTKRSQQQSFNFSQTRK